MKRVALAVALSTVAGSAAFAADLPPPVAPPRAPAVYTPAPVPYYNWTGFYIGGNLGASWQQGSFGDQFGNNFRTNNQFTGTGGGQVGVNYEFSSGVVVGAEAMFDWRFNNGNTSNTITLAGTGSATRHSIAILSTINGSRRRPANSVTLGTARSFTPRLVAPGWGQTIRPSISTA